MNSRAQEVPQLTTRTLQSADDFKAVHQEWQDLFSRCREATPFQHPDWVLPWINAFNPRDLVGVEVREGNRLVGFAPLLIYPRGDERVLAFAAGGVSDYLGLLIEPGREPRVLAAVLDAAQQIPHWTVLDFTDLRCSSSLLESGRFSNYSRPHDVCFVLPLPQSPDELIETLTKRQWANLRNARSRSQREGEATIEHARPETVREFLDDLFRLHTTRWAELGQDGVVNEHRIQQLHREATPAFLEDGLLRLWRMRLKGRTIAVIYSLFHQETAFCYLQGFDPDYSHLSPGTQLMFAVIEDAVRQGMHRFDFLRGKEAYKLHWRPDSEQTYRIEIPRQTLTTRSLDLAA
jgi:CelD/BcsL family acetyltransferase involved in cellulose biosynthesis